MRAAPAYARRGRPTRAGAGDAIPDTAPLSAARQQTVRSGPHRAGQEKPEWKRSVAGSLPTRVAARPLDE